MRSRPARSVQVAGPVELAGGEAGGVDAHDDVVLGGVRIGQVGQGEPADTGVTVSYGDGLHVGSFHAVSRTLSGVLADLRPSAVVAAVCCLAERVQADLPRLVGPRDEMPAGVERGAQGQRRR